MIRYAPEFFNRATEEEARKVILSPGGGLTVEQRWEIETKWLAERLVFPDGGIVIDYGCGIGRVSKALRRPMLGVDISFDMLRMAASYVNRTDFAGVSPAAFRVLVEAGLRATARSPSGRCSTSSTSGGRSRR